MKAPITDMANNQSHRQGHQTRLTPVSAEAVQLGFENVFNDDNPLAPALEKFQRYRAIYNYVRDLPLLQYAAVLSPDWEPSERLARANMLVVISGAALYFTCLKEEAKIKRVGFPKVTDNDGTFAISKLMPSENPDLPPSHPGYFEAMAKNMLARTAERAREFDMVETDFCTMAIEYFAPERGYGGDFWHDTQLGASQVYHLVDAHYERAALKALSS